MSNARQNMILLKGGLGNQLFQYSFFHLLKRNNVPIDGFFPHYQLDSYGRTLEIDKFVKNLKVYNEIPTGSKTFASENYDAIKNALLSETGSLIIKGYFQNYDYVKSSSIENIIKIPIVSQRCTALHLRRSDYGHHGLLPIKYYYEALEQLGNPNFVVFTDEPNFALYYFKKVAGLVNIFPSNASNATRDFLHLCSYDSIIIANSSYSWFAAYLAHAQRGSTIIAPDKWSLSGPGPGYSGEWRVIDANLIVP
jgi:hypothetical protein